MATQIPAALVLENALAKLESLRTEHLPGLLSIGLEPLLWRYTNKQIRTEADMQEYLETAMTEVQKGLSHVFVIYDKRSGEMAGCTRFGNIVWEHKRLEIGWTWYLPRFQRTGLNRACKALLLQYAFETLDMNRVELKTSWLNLPSRTAIARIGAKEEGVLRMHQVLEDGAIRDTVYFSIVKPEWPLIRSQVFSQFIS